MWTEGIQIDFDIHLLLMLALLAVIALLYQNLLLRKQVNRQLVLLNEENRLENFNSQGNAVSNESVQPVTGVKQCNPQTVLIVDDSYSTILLIKSLLKDEYRIKAATNGQKGIEIARQEEVDLILLDVVMPDMDGYETCRRLKGDPRTQHIPIIFVTGMDGVPDETRGLKLGAVDYLVKPVCVPILKARVRNHMELKRYRDSLEILCMIDSLTDIPNRRQFETALDKEWRRAIRIKETLSVFFIDIDGFTEYNGNHGRLDGDECIRQVARVLNRTANRGGDMVARYDGEKFVALACSLSTEGALALGELFRSAVEKASPVTISVGVAVMQPEQSNLPKMILDRADRALYKAKNEGRNRVAFYSAESSA